MFLIRLSNAIFFSVVTFVLINTLEKINPIKLTDGELATTFLLLFFCFISVLVEYFAQIETRELREQKKQK